MIEYEPIFNLSIKVIGTPTPIEYKNKRLADVANILEKWSMHWILTPVGDCKLSDDIWYWSARERRNNGDSWPEYQETVLDELRSM